MSKISLAPNAAGSAIFTIESPGTSTNRTLTLPDDTGTIVTNSGNQAGSFTTLNTSGAVVFNDAGADVDFRVEGDTDANLLFVDASADAVGIGTNAPDAILQVGALDSSGNDRGALAIKTQTVGTITPGEAAIYIEETSGSEGFYLGVDVDGGMFFSNSGSTTPLYISDSDNVGIGTSSPTAELHIKGAQPADAFDSQLLIDTTDTTGTIDYGSKISFGYYDGANGRVGPYILGAKENSTSGNYASYLAFATRANGGNPTERARITSSGAFLINSTTLGANSAKLYVNGLVDINAVIITKGFQTRPGTAGAQGSNSFNINWTGSVAQLYIDSSNLGTISVSSDYRIKRNIETQAQEALSRISQLRPVTYQRADYGTLFKADDEVREGFIAHELAEVIPSAVDGEKDAENQIQSLKLDALCSVMVKAIQELKAELDTVKAELATLKG